jgi:hypothetical protein
MSRRQAAQASADDGCSVAIASGGVRHIERTVICWWGVAATSSCQDSHAVAVAGTGAVRSVPRRGPTPHSIVGAARRSDPSPDSAMVATKWRKVSAPMLLCGGQYFQIGNYLDNRRNVTWRRRCLVGRSIVSATL